MGKKKTLDALERETATQALDDLASKAKGDARLLGGPNRSAVLANAEAYELAAIELRRGEWQPIATAPKGDPKSLDGAPRVLVFVPDAKGGSRVDIGHFDHDQYARKPRPFWDYTWGRYVGKTHTREHQPSHWMPLPEVPA